MQVLIIEDDPNMATMIQITLEKLGGYSAAVAGSPQLAQVALQKQKFDLILMDYYLPEMNGLELMSQIEKSHENWTHLIFLTGQSDPYVLDKMRKSKALGFITKPFDPLDLVNEIKAKTNMRFTA